MLNLIKENSVLVGEYPEILDLHQHKFEREFFWNDGTEFKQAEAEGRPPKPCICISGSDTVKVIYFPIRGYEYAVIENLPTLRELHICREPNERYRWKGDLQWLICRNLPSLKKITVDDDALRWLQLEGMDSLESVDVSKAENLDYCSIKNTPVLKQVDVRGCKKLRDTHDMPIDIQRKLKITGQIKKNQEESRNDGLIYENMTFTDIDTVLETLNRAAKLATSKNLLPDDYCYGQEKRPDFKMFSIHRLRPLEAVYTGGTGETYFYDFQTHDCIHGKDGIGSSTGYSELEHCLEGALNHMVDLGLEVPGLSALEAKLNRTRSHDGWHKVQKEIEVFVLNFLNQLVARKRAKQGSE